MRSESALDDRTRATIPLRGQKRAGARRSTTSRIISVGVTFMRRIAVAGVRFVRRTAVKAFLN
jgi:hypothetical protein